MKSIFLRTRIVSLMNLALMLCLSFSTQADSSTHNDVRYERLISSLNMTDAQATQFRQVMNDTKANRKNRHEQRQKIKNLSNNGDIEAAADLAAQYARERVYHRALVQEKLAAFLTPTQMSQLQQYREQRHKKRRQRQSNEV